VRNSWEEDFIADSSFIEGIMGVCAYFDFNSGLFSMRWKLGFS